MKVLIINVDSKIPNLALKKIEKYHLDRGDEVIWNNELFQFSVDKTYVSIVFDWNKDKAKQFPNAEIGGSGFSLKKTLPSEIDKVKPRINLGFTTRGCIRKCSFCIVPKKEGGIKIVGDIYDIWDGKSKNLIILDNNILALPNHFKKICEQLRKEKIKVDFNQGLDCRLLTGDIAKDLKSISHIEYRFAFDDIKLRPQVEKAIKLLRECGINRCNWYVLVGFNTTFEEDLDRLNLLRDLKQNAYVQRYNAYKADRKYIPLARWANQHHIFQAMNYLQFLEKCKKEIGGSYLSEWV
ncbi:MAG: hypothetical protein HQ579_08105 [Candidatus Omnitrophica bacterium]|nr:hypothetical protein [Candidatus Omnitrophota bacterium]